MKKKKHVFAKNKEINCSSQHFLITVIYVVFGLAGFTLRCNIREEKKVTMPTKLSECLVIWARLHKTYT